MTQEGRRFSSIKCHRADKTSDFKGSIVIRKDFTIEGDLAFGDAVADTFVLAGRMSTSTAAGAALDIDATTYQYGEGMEMRYTVSDWADTYTLTSFKGLYLRAQNEEANASGSIYGTEIYGVANNVNTGYVWGALVYAYSKGATARTISGMYAIQPELTFDAGSTTHTITDAACVRAKVTGGKMADYTNLDGYRLTLGDMNGASPAYGNGLLMEDDSDTSGTCTLTTGINIDIACADGILIAGACSDNGIEISGACTGSGIEITGATNLGIYLNPTVTADTSMYPIRIAYNYPGATINTGVDMDCYGIRSTITQTTSNDDATLGQRGYIQGMRSGVVVDGYVDDAYSLYAKMTVSGTSVANQLYGLNSVFSHGALGITMDETGNIAGVGISMNGTGDVTCGGTGYGKVSGMYINWNETNAMTVDTCGVYIGVQSGATLDSGYRVNASGTLTSSFLSYNSSGTMTNAIEVYGAHSYFANFDNATTCATTTTSGAATTIKGNILVKTVAGDTGYINVYGSAGS